jgi:hypothetical protein
VLSQTQLECRPPTNDRCTAPGRTTKCDNDAGYRWCCADDEDCGAYPGLSCKPKAQQPNNPAPQPPRAPGGGGEPAPNPPAIPKPQPPNGNPNPQPPTNPEPAPNPNPKPVDPPPFPTGQCREALMCAWQLQEEWWRCVAREYQKCNEHDPRLDDDELMQCLSDARYKKCKIDRTEAADCSGLCKDPHNPPGPDQTCSDPLQMYCSCVDASGNLLKVRSSETELSKVGQACDPGACAKPGTLECSFRDNHTKPGKPKEENKDEGGMSGAVDGSGYSSAPGISK